MFKNILTKDYPKTRNNNCIKWAIQKYFLPVLP